VEQPRFLGYSGGMKKCALEVDGVRFSARGYDAHIKNHIQENFFTKNYVLTKTTITEKKLSDMVRDGLVRTHDFGKRVMYNKKDIYNITRGGQMSFHGIGD
jgi:lipoate-protein ligase B